MKQSTSVRLAAIAAITAAFSVASAAPVEYTIDSDHTHPSFESDHMGGVSVWRGMFKKTTGKVMYDKDAKAGSVEAVIDISSVEIGNDRLNTHLKNADFFDVEKYPTATFTGKLVFGGDTPSEVQGSLTMRGVTKPITLKVNSFLCKPNAMTKMEVCGADAIGTFNREDFGMNFGKQFGFKMETTLRIQVEAKRPLPASPA